jgi:hypothetical protein
MKHTSTYLAVSTNRIFAVGQRKIHQRPLHSARVAVRCGVANFSVIGPYFFEDEDGRAVTVTSARYVEMLQNRVFVELSSRPYGSSKMVQLPIQRERKIFLEHAISLCGKLPWPAR